MNEPRDPNHPSREAGEHDAVLSRLYRQGRVGEPSRKLDAAILHAARAAVEKPAGKRRPWFFAGWAMPISAAALVLLTVSLVIRMQHELPPEQSIEAERPPESPVSGRQAGEFEADMFQDAEPVRERRAPKRLRQKNGEPAEGAGLMVPPETGGYVPRTVAPAGRMKRWSATGAGSPEDKARHADPEAWLEEIIELKRQKKFTEAAASLKAFRKQYPDYPLPTGLP